MLVDNPLLTFLGRRGRGAVVEAMLRNPGRTWSVRDLARFADVAPMVAHRAARELEALGAVEWTRTGRDAQIRLRLDAPAAAFLARLDVLDLRAAAADAFAAAYQRPRGVTQLLNWVAPREDRADPAAPCRIAIVTNRDEAEALAGAKSASAAARDAGWGDVEVSVYSQDRMEAGDATARAVLAGRIV